ncbi:MAG: hypothetical protein Q7J98_02635 [Kiritimatiellia bacterium]|nr:hypothetical protein [Kiritimatiellia bacterium]
MSLVETVKLHDANPLDLMMNLAVGTDSAKIKTMLFASNTSWEIILYPKVNASIIPTLPFPPADLSLRMAKELRQMQGTVPGHSGRDSAVEVAHTAAGLTPAGRKSREGEMLEAALCLRSVENLG